MPQFLAIEWDQFEVRVVAARGQGENVQVEQAFAVPLNPRDPGQTFADTNIADRLAAALSARKIGKSETLVAVGRSNIELRLLSLPPAPDEELPDMVRFVATPQFSNLGDDWPLDFVRTISESGQAQNVLAATISPKVVEQITTTCEAAGFKPTRLILRPCAAASLLVARRPVEEGKIRVLVDLLADEADLTVLVGETIVLMRTVRLPGTPNSPEQQTSLVGELRRTIAAAQNQLGGKRVQQIVLCGRPGDLQWLADRVRDDFSLPLETFDPLEGFQLSREVSAKPPLPVGRFAPLLGMILSEARGVSPAIDFLNPRRRPAPPNHRRRFAFIGAAVGTLALAIVMMVWWYFGDLNSQITALEAKSAALKETVAKAELKRKDLDRIEAWRAGDVMWLDQLHDLSLPANFPPAEDVRLTQMRSGVRPSGGGELVIEGLARDSAVVAGLESLLRATGRQSRAGANLSDKRDAKYPWRFDETIIIEPAAPTNASSPSTAAGGAR